MGTHVGLNGSGPLFALRMRRISSTVGAMSPLIWAAPCGGNEFIFIDDTLNPYDPTQNNNTADVIAIQQQYFGHPLFGCQIPAADVNGDGRVDTVDVTAVVRFFLGQTTGIGNVGKYHFTPTNRTCTGVLTNQTAQDYNAFVFGDCASHFVE